MSVEQVREDARVAPDEWAEGLLELIEKNKAVIRSIKEHDNDGKIVRDRDL